MLSNMSLFALNRFLVATLESHSSCVDTLVSVLFRAMMACGREG